MKMKKIFIILCLIGLAINSYSQRGGAEYDYLKVRKELSVYGDTTLREYIEEHAPSGTARDAGSGTSLDGNDLDWNGTLDKDVEISGAGNSVEIGTDASKVTNFLVKASTGASFEAPYIGFNAGIEWNLVDEYWISENGDTLSDRDVVRELILESKNTLPFNFDYTFNSSIIDSRPGIGYFKFNYQTLSSVTEIYIDYFDQNTISQNVFLSAADSGSYLAIQSSTNNYALYQLNDGYIDNGNYYTYKVDYIGHNGVVSGSSVLDLNISNNTGGGSVSTGSDSTLTSSTNTITLSSGVLDGSGIDAVFDEVDATSFRGDYFYVRDSYDDDSTTVYRHPGTGFNIEDNIAIVFSRGTSTLEMISNGVEINTGDIQLITTNDIHIGTGDRIELEADGDMLLYAGAGQTVISDDTIRSDGSGSSTANTLLIKNVTATDNVEANSVKATNITSDSQTLAGIELTGVSTSKEAIEGTEVDKFKTDTIILGTDTITSGSKEMSMYIFDASITIAVTQNEYSVITGWIEGYNQDDYFTVLNDSVQLVPGDYAIEYDLSFEGISTEIIIGKMFIDGVEVTTGGGFKRGMSGTDSEVVGTSWKGTISSTSYISFRLTNTVNSNAPVISYGDISIRKIK